VLPVRIKSSRFILSVEQFYPSKQKELKLPSSEIGVFQGKKEVKLLVQKNWVGPFKNLVVKALWILLLTFPKKGVIWTAILKRSLEFLLVKGFGGLNQRTQGLLSDLTSLKRFPVVAVLRLG